MSEASEPVARYLSEHDMSTGVTVPVHMPRGDYATVTGIRLGQNGDFKKHALRYIADFGLLAHVFHEAAFCLFDNSALTVAKMRLTERSGNACAIPPRDFRPRKSRGSSSAPYRPSSCT